MANPSPLLRRSSAALLLALLPLAACNGQTETTAPNATAQAESQVLATVNGEPITEAQVEAFRRENAGAQPQGRDARSIVEELIARQLVEADAREKKLIDQPEVQAELAQAREKILLSAAIRNYLEQNPVTEDELKKVYSEQVTKIPAGTEYKARHILVESEDKAKALIEQLNKGADFAELAKKESTGPSGSKGGDLGWFEPQQMVPPFSAAVQKLEKGKITQSPVQTQFGWHVIQLEDTRSQQPPTLEQVRPQLERVLQQQHVSEYLDSLKQAAKIDYHLDETSGNAKQ